MQENQSRWSVIITMAGAMMASLIGSGFATGQEIIQYFVSRGWLGTLSILTIFIGFSFVGYSLFTVGYDHQEDLLRTNDIYHIYTNQFFGRVYEGVSFIAIFLTYSVMIAGAGATIQQQFALPVYIGSSLMFALVALVVMLGLNRLTDILGKLGPIIAIAAIILGIYAFIVYWDRLPQAEALIQEAVQNKEIQTSSGNWLISGLNYVGYNLILFAGYLSQTGRQARSNRDSAISGTLGGGFFSIAVFISYLGFMASFSVSGKASVPTLILANDIHPLVGWFFVIMIMCGIFTTAVTLLWNSVSVFAEDGTKRYKILTLIVGLIGLIIGSVVSFDHLLNIVYNVAGYFGIALIAVMVWRQIEWRKK